MERKAKWNDEMSRTYVMSRQSKG